MESWLREGQLRPYVNPATAQSDPQWAPDWAAREAAAARARGEEGFLRCELVATRDDAHGGGRRRREVVAYSPDDAHAFAALVASDAVQAPLGAYLDALAARKKRAK